MKEMCYYKKIDNVIWRKAFLAGPRHCASMVISVLKSPVIIGLIRSKIEIVAVKMKLDHGGKIEKEKQLFFLSDVSVYLSYMI